MWFKAIVFFGVTWNILHVENIMLPYETKSPPLEESLLFDMTSAENIDDKVMALKTFEDRDHEELGFELETKRLKTKPKKPCAIVVLSNIQNPGVQSLLRKYRYDANGILIPSSVKYFIKMPQGHRSAPILVPLNDKAFSPLGGFVRYYKEVPPIPQAW